MNRPTFERIYTRDKMVPLPEYPDDVDLNCGWQCIPVPPPNDGQGTWEIFDTSKDYKTGWARFRGVDWANISQQ